MSTNASVEDPEDAEARAVLWVKAKCEIASMYVEGLSDPDPQKRQYERGSYEKHRDEGIRSALAIKDEFSQCMALHQVIDLCRSANELELARTLFKEVDDDSLRALILRSAPELAGEKKKRLSGEEKALKTVTINLDGLDRKTIIQLVTNAMRDVGMPERDIEDFKEGAIKADYDKLLASAIGWEAPVRFLKAGQPWVRGDWRRLSGWQRIKRRVSLWGGSYQHPDGSLELDFDEKAGVDPRDSNEVKEAKIDAYIQRQGVIEARAVKVWLFAGGVVVGYVLCKYFGW